MNQVNGYDQDPMHIHDNKPPFLFWNQYYPNFYVKKFDESLNTCANVSKMEALLKQ